MWWFIAYCEAVSWIGCILVLLLHLGVFFSYGIVELWRSLKRLLESFSECGEQLNVDVV